MTVLESITYIIEERKKNRKIPHCAMLEDVTRMCKLPAPELKEQLNELRKAGKIAYKQTINSKSIYLT